MKLSSGYGVLLLVGLGCVHAITPTRALDDPLLSDGQSPGSLARAGSERKSYDAPFWTQSRNCPACDDTYAELQRLKQSHDSLQHFLRDVVQTVGGRYQVIGCMVAAGNGTCVIQLERSCHPSLVSCENVPFRDVAHAITAYALNQSDMYLQIRDPWNPKGQIEYVVPNAWFREAAVEMSLLINALPGSAWKAFKLNNTAGWCPSFTETFDALIGDTTTLFIRETSESWPWAPPPPPPPPTPPPCPGGSLQVCIHGKRMSSCAFHLCLSSCCTLCSMKCDTRVNPCGGAGMHRFLQRAHRCLQALRAIVFCCVSQCGGTCRPEIGSFLEWFGHSS